MPGLFVTVAAILAGAGISAQRGAPAPRDPYPKQPLSIERIQQWARAVWSHEPGLLDPAAVSISQWTPPELYMLFTELRLGLLKFPDRPRIYDPVDGHRYPTPRKKATLIYALEIPSDSDEDVNRLFKRAALLHTDVASLVPPQAFFSLPSPFSGRVTFLTKDGAQVALAGTAVHLEFVSWLFDGIKPDPGGDPVVSLWYEAVSAALQAEHRVGDADWLLFRGIDAAPLNPRLHFYYGAVQETLSSPRVQNALPDHQTRVRDNPRTRLEQAERTHRQAVGLSPDFAEARLHLGRVIGQLGRPSEAIRELLQAEPSLTDRVLQYHCALFLGQQRVLTADLTSAQVSFARAHDLYPKAQSPLIALADVAQRRGDSAGAVEALRKLLALPAADAERFDPWWRYDDAHVRDAKIRLTAWRAVVAGETSR
jgi:hypothetical protein